MLGSRKVAGCPCSGLPSRRSDGSIVAREVAGVGLHRVERRHRVPLGEHEAIALGPVRLVRPVAHLGEEQRLHDVDRGEGAARVAASRRRDRREVVDAQVEGTATHRCQSISVEHFEGVEFSPTRSRAARRICSGGSATYEGIGARSRVPHFGGHVACAGGAKCESLRPNRCPRTPGARRHAPRPRSSWPDRRAGGSATSGRCWPGRSSSPTSGPRSSTSPRSSTPRSARPPPGSCCSCRSPSSSWRSAT